ncbi:MAG: T9SS type A sorting domain-containing protein [Ignavibacteriales bacterium]|nr:T9SS type A sorting domain-containing protein [Ignavibacteriales bacterium]
MKIYLFFFVIVFLNINIHAQWVQKNSITQEVITTLITNGNYIFAGTNGNGVFRSSDMGENWTQINIGLTGSKIRAFAIIGDNIFVASEGSGIFISSNNGSNWNSLNNGLEETYFRSLHVDGNNLYAVGTGGAIFLSTNNGTNWENITTPGQQNYSILFKGTKRFVSDIYDGIFVTTDNGLNWKQIINGLNSYYIYPPFIWKVGSMSLCGNSIFISQEWDIDKGLFRSINDGEQWVQVSEGIKSVEFASPIFEMFGNNIFLANHKEIYLSTDNGDNWFLVNYGLPDEYINTLVIVDTVIFVGTGGNGVWCRSLTEIITAIGNEKNNLPSNYTLEQNYPNPFNPTTTIQFQVPKFLFVNIKVYDVLGREVANLVNEEKPAGTYQVSFDAAILSSGVYLYKLNAGSFIETKKMILLR